MITTLKLQKQTKEKLKRFKTHPNETYDQVLRKVIYIAETVRDEPELSQKTVREIEESREQFLKGDYYTWEEVCEELGFDISAKIKWESKRRPKKPAKKSPKQNY